MNEKAYKLDPAIDNSKMFKLNMFDEPNKNEELANKLIKNEVKAYELSEDEVDSMIDFFNKDIEALDKELEKTKLHIIQMKKKLAK